MEVDLNGRGIKMEITLNNDYCLQFNETYFVSRRNSKKDVRDYSDIPVSDTKIRYLGRKLFKGMLKTIKEIFVVIWLLAVCKYAGLYDLWVQIADKLV